MLDRSTQEAIKDMDVLTVGILDNMAKLLLPTMKSKILGFYFKRNVCICQRKIV